MNKLLYIKDPKKYIEKVDLYQSKDNYHYYIVVLFKEEVFGYGEYFIPEESEGFSFTIGDLDEVLVGLNSCYEDFFFDISKLSSRVYQITYIDVINFTKIEEY